MAMSLMTENLLLHAQSLREEGELDASIDLLRVVISQCNSDTQKEEEDLSHRVANGDNNVKGDILRVETIGKLRQTAAYQLALLLLQRSGRQSSNSLDDIDEKEADDLLWKLGYRLRLSKLAFGYPRCICNNHQPLPQGKEPLRSENHVGVSAIDNLLPTSIFDALQHAFRSDSRYWSEFYISAGSDQGNLSPPVDDHATQRSNTHHFFASHNIPLPTNPMLSEKLQSSKSILEQVAIIAQHRLQDRFPDILKATSVEVWSHRRSSDGHHKLHYDMDEIRLWKHRLLVLEERDKKRRKMQDATRIDSILETKRRRDRLQLANTDGISCPIVSCVLTINVPGDSNFCSCGRKENSAPTIICNQSIVRRNGCQSNSGCLCFPSPNRLLAFEGSLLHGVMPGIPFLHASSASSEESDDSCSSDGEGRTVNNYRITFMMGFWETVSTMPTSSITSAERGPNVPLDIIQHDNSWTDEFKPHSVTSDDVAAVRASVSHVNKHFNLHDIQPLWVPVIHDKETRKSFGEYTSGNAMMQRGRFFLKSLDSTEIDHEILNGEIPVSEDI